MTKSNIRIAFILPSLANRGPVVFTKYLVEHLILNVEKLDIYYLDDIKDLDISCSCHKINKLSDIKLEDYDIIHSTMFRPDFFTSIKRKTLPLKTKIVSGIHNHIKEDMIYNYGNVKGRFISLIWHHVLKKFDGVIYSSEMMSHYYSSQLDVKSEVIPYGITKLSVDLYKKVDFQKEIEELKSKYQIIGAVGLLIARKGFHQIISALVEIPSVALVIIGEGPERKTLERLINKHELQDRVILTGFQSDSKAYYRYFDMYCLSSYSEGFGLAMLEALSAGIPLICSRLDIYEEYFSDVQVSKFKLNDTRSLVESISKTQNNLEYYSKESLNLYEKHFDVSVMARKHISFYERIINE